MANKIEELRSFLKRSRMDLSKNGRGKERWINNVMGQVQAILDEKATPAKAAAPAPEAPQKPKHDPTRIQEIKATGLGPEIGPGGIVQMDGSQSMRADIECGNNPFGGNTNE